MLQLMAVNHLHQPSESVSASSLAVIKASNRRDIVNVMVPKLKDAKFMIVLTKLKVLTKAIVNVITVNSFLLLLLKNTHPVRKRKRLNRYERVIP